MTSPAIRSNDADFSADFDFFSLPVSRGVEGMWLFGASSAASTRNLIYGKPAASVVGAPVVSANSLRLKGLTNFLQTSIAQAPEMTIYVVGKSTDTFVGGAGSPMFVSNFQSPRASDTSKTSNGVSLAILASTGAPQATVSGIFSVIAADGPASSIASAANVSIPDMTAYKLMTARKAGSTREMRNETAGTVNSIVSALPDDLGNGLLRIGSGYTSYAGYCDIAAVVIANVAHTTDERAAINASIRALMTFRGVGSV